MTTFLADTLAARQITVEHLADLLAPTSEAVVRSWVDGSSSPAPDDLLPLSIALRLHPVEMIAGWLIDQSPRIEEAIRPIALDSIGSNFPRSTNLALRAPSPRIDMSVGDPHDRPYAARIEAAGTRPVRRRAAGVRTTDA